MARLIVILSVLLATSSSISGFAPSNNQHHQTTGTARYAGTVLDGQEIRGPITPLGNYVVVRTKDTLMATGGGILLPDQVGFRHSLESLLLVC